jgi:hypothetical protein
MTTQTVINLATRKRVKRELTAPELADRAAQAAAAVVAAAVEAEDREAGALRESILESLLRGDPVNGPDRARYRDLRPPRE